MIHLISNQKWFLETCDPLLFLNKAILSFRLEPKMEEDVVPIMIIYAVVGVVLALMELISVVLACAYVAQITRRLSKDHEDRNFRGMGDAGRNYSPDETDTLNNPNHETVC